MTIREQNEQREHAVLEPWATLCGQLPQAGCADGTVSVPHLLSARPGLHYPFKGVPAAGQQDAGIYLAGG